MECKNRMKVYTLVASDYEGSDTWKICKSRKKAEKLMEQCKRLQKLYKNLRDWQGISRVGFQNTHPELDAGERAEGWYDTQDWETYQYWEKQLDELFKELGTSSFYSKCYIVEMKLE